MLSLTRVVKSVNWRKVKERNVLSEPYGHKAVLISVSLALTQTSVCTARPQSRGVSVYALTFADIDSAYPRRDGQAELT